MMLSCICDGSYYLKTMREDYILQIVIVNSVFCFVLYEREWLILIHCNY